MRVALYARVSTKDKGQDPESQLMPLRDFIKARQHESAGEYIDIGWSGAKERRPQLDRLMTDAKRKKFDAVLVARFDRFARSVKHLIAALETFQALGLHFISLSESIDTSTPMGKMVFTVLAAVAELERELIRERVKAGIDRAKRQGKRLGRPSVLVDRESILQKAGAGLTISQIAREHGISRPTVRDIIKNAGFDVIGEKAEKETGEKPLAD